MNEHKDTNDIGANQAPPEGDKDVNPYRPPAMPSPGGGHGGERLSAVLRLAWPRIRTALLWPCLVLAGAQFLLVTVPNALWDYRLALVSGGSGAEASGSSAYLQLTISLTATLFIGALQLGLAVPLRALMVDGLAARAPLGITLRMAAHRYWHVLWALAAWHCFMLAGFMFCLAPGLMVCFFLLLAPYLASQGASTPDALVESARLARRHSPTVLACVLVGTAYFALTVTTTMETQIAIHESNMVPFEAMISQLAQGLVVDLMSGFFWLFWAVVAVHVETTDRGIPLAE